MPYILLLIGLLIGIIALYRFFVRASVEEMKSFIFAAVTLTLCLALFILAVTGRLPAAIAILAAIWPIALGVWKSRQLKKQQGQNPQNKEASNTEMNRDEALEILGLEEGASKKKIQDSYKNLMSKVHPDQEGSEWMASKLNQARDLLLKD